MRIKTGLTIGAYVRPEELPKPPTSSHPNASSAATTANAIQLVVSTASSAVTKTEAES